ncbi:MAG: GGDEF domain-containing protein, partial [Desulfobacterales bacterium]|nr:GGDEF domain-containing protein [Desulfobacterales bacterium]
KNADTAMYHAKNAGRNNFQFYAKYMNERTLSRLNMEAKLKKALERNEFILYYQPQVESATSTIVGVEALIRWEHPEMGLVSPNEFIPIAEETRLIIPIGEWVLRTACAQMAVWHKAGFNKIRVGVNLSSLQFRQGNIVKTIKNILATTGLDPQYLELELTESMVMQNVEETIATLWQLKEMGLKLSIDDFGTGYSSMSYLKRFPLDTLKIDRSFIKDIMTDSSDAAITKATIGLAQGLELTTIAEGIETKEQLTFLRKQGCDQIQGYFISRPVPAEKVEQLFAKT